MREEEVPPDELRCHRSDGKQWRCFRRAMEGKKMCEVHHLQLSLRQHKHKVPESLKLVRGKNKTRNEEIESNGETRAAKGTKSKKGVKRKRVIEESEALDEVVKKMKLKRGDTQLELIRMVLKREVYKTKQQKNEKKKKNTKKKERDKACDESEDSDGEDFRRILPNGIMAISSESPLSPNAASSGDTKVGAQPVAATRRRFRSKNIEPIPLGTLQAVPYKGNLLNLMKEKRKRCHWCDRRKDLKNLSSCSSCRKYFCADCIKERCTDPQDAVEIKCPVCQGTCSCKGCLFAKPKDTQCKDFLRDKVRLNRVLHLHYLICMLLPVLKQVNKEETLEIEREQQCQGQNKCEVEISTAKSSLGQRHCWILNGNLGHIAKCSYGTKACETSTQEMQRHEARDFNSCVSMTDREAAEGNGAISCPPEKVDGCGNKLFAPRHELPVWGTKKLEASAEEIVSSYELPETLDTSSSCLLCLGTQNQEAARRKESMNNFLFRSTIKDFHNDNLEHFQKHWSQGHPVTVQNVLGGASDLSWDPIALFCTYLKNSNNKSQCDVNKAAGCLDWFEVEIGINQLFVGSFRGCAETNTCHEKLKLKGWLSSNLFQEQFPAHYNQIINALPIPHYMDPNSGLLNVAANLPEEFPKPDLGPCVHISYNSANELAQPDCVTKLCFDFCDVVNILVHTTNAPASTKHICRIRKLMKGQNAHAQRRDINTDSNQMMDNQMKSNSPLRSRKIEVGLDSDSDNEKLVCERGTKELNSAPAADKTHDRSLKPRAGRGESDSKTFSGLETSETCSSTPINSKRFENGEFSEKERESCKTFRRQNLAKSCGAQWDVFRRQDVPKLLEYLRRHAQEKDNANCFGKHESHTVLGQHFFLDAAHKQRLKEEFEIEPWTFEQHVGEAVIVPAGCPYQMRKIKSCVNVVVHFLSPENVSECIRRTDDLLLFPGCHNAGLIVDKLEVKKMAIHSISEAIKEIRELTGAESISH